MNFANAVDSIERAILNVKFVQEQDSEKLLEHTYNPIQTLTNMQDQCGKLIKFQLVRAVVCITFVTNSSKQHLVNFTVVNSND